MGYHACKSFLLISCLSLYFNHRNGNGVIRYSYFIFLCAELQREQTPRVISQSKLRYSQQDVKQHKVVSLSHCESRVCQAHRRAMCWNLIWFIATKTLEAFSLPLNKNQYRLLLNTLLSVLIGNRGMKRTMDQELPSNVIEKAKSKRWQDGCYEGIEHRFNIVC